MAKDVVKNEKAEILRNRLYDLAMKLCDDVEQRKYQNPTEIVNCIEKIYSALTRGEKEQ